MKTKNLANYDWYCDHCNAKLNDQPGFDFSRGPWECTECGHINLIDESQIIDDMSDEEYEKFFDKYLNDVPEGCKACGGPYPSCKSSCKMFDD